MDIFYVVVVLLSLVGCASSYNKNETEDIIVNNNSEKLTKKQAKKYAKTIQDIMIETQKGIYSIEDFELTFQDGDGEIDVTVESDWIMTRKPEENPVLLGMEEEMEKLEDEQEKEVAQKVIEGFKKELEGDYQENKTKHKVEETLKLIQKDTEKGEYDIFYPEQVDGKITLYPMKEYYDQNYKEDPEQRKELGRKTLLENLEIEKTVVLTQKQLHRIKNKIKEYYDTIHLDIESMKQVDLLPTFLKEYEGYSANELIFFEVKVQGKEVNRGIILGIHDDWVSCQVLNEGY